MIIKNTFITLIALFCFVQITAQQSAIYVNEIADYQKALSLYNNQQYLAAQSLFKQIKKTAENDIVQSDCAFYIANCAIRLNQQNADQLVDSFVDDYPTSTKRNTAFLDVANYYFTNGRFAYAKKWYDKVDESSLSRNERERYNFNNGYVAFVTKDLNTAKSYLGRVENSEKYGSQAKYYLGFMAYQSDDYEQANAYFDQVSEEDRYKEKLSYYQADLHFKLGQFEKAIELAKDQLPKSNRNEVSELNKIIGESYFNLNRYAEAIPFLTEYKGRQGKWNNTDYYQLGFAYYKQDDFGGAINEFNKIIGGNNGVAQNAYYHLGESYIRLDRKQEALNAFRNASEMDFDLKIQEDAWLNYAKISYDIGNPYQPVPDILNTFLERYPKSLHAERIESLLIDSYITSRNYKEALRLLKGKSSYEDKLAYQKVTFYRGIELYNDNRYHDAEELFDQSLTEPLDAVFTARAIFWKAETDYNLTDFNDALIGFKQFKQESASIDTPEMTHVDYNLAYAYFKKKNYSEASKYFMNYIGQNSKDKIRINDAYLRLGDGYFVSSEYSKAIDAYEKAIGIGEMEMDYASFQKAISQGYIGKSDTKIMQLEAFIEQFPDSKLRDDALYELGNSYVKLGRTTEAMTAYNRLNMEYERSIFVPKAMLRQGLVHYNASENERALKLFKQIASDYPGSPEANQAVSTSRLIYIDLGRVEEYAAWVRTLSYVDVTDEELDKTSFEAAEKKYIDGDTDEAIRLFNSYLNSFPEGIHMLQAHFYLAQLYFKNDLKENAMPHYKAVTVLPPNEFTEESLLRLSQIYTELKQWKTAVPVLVQLENEASFPQNVIFAQSNLMKAYYAMEAYDNAVIYAEKVLSRGNIDSRIKSDAHVIIARSAIKTNDLDKARAAYENVEHSSTGEIAAEALFYNAYFKFNDGRFEESNEMIQRLAQDYPGYKYYSAKGLVIMAKNYDALNDAFQATYILESVIKNFTQFGDVVEEAQAELNRIKTEQAKTNSSVVSED